MSDRACTLCNRCTDDALQFGEKCTYENTTAHLYCLLLTSNLVQNGQDHEGISGFMPKDIKNEVSRTKKLLCHYCHEKSATIGCCVKSCRRSFHLPCAIENDCRLEFTNTFRSFCDIHVNIKKPKQVHKPTDLCTICYDEMGKYNAIRSISLPCCNKNAWCHKLCLQKYAQTSGYFLKCPLCKDSEKFRHWIAQRGVFIPDRDAKWEVDESGPNSFYGFEQHSERPSKCEAKVCKCSRGRNYQIDLENNRHSLIYCDYCGSHAIHLGCLKDDDYVCDECTELAARARENAARATTIKHTEIEKLLIAKHKLREFSICLRRLTPDDLSYKSDLDNDYTTDTSARDSDSSDCQTDRILPNQGSSYTSSDVESLTYSSNESSTYKISSRQSSSSGSSRSRNSSIGSTSSGSTSCGSTSCGSTSCGSTSSELDIKPLVLCRKSSVVSSSDVESENGQIKPAKRTRIWARNQFFDSESDAEIVPKVDINENSKDFPSSNLNRNSHEDNKLKQTSHTASRARLISQSTSESDNQSKSNASNLRTLLFSESSDDQIFGKENEYPSKNVAVIRPYSMAESTSSDNITPIKSIITKRLSSTTRLSSSDDFSSSNESVQPTKQARMTTSTFNANEYENKTAGIRNISIKLSPLKKRRRTVLSYLRETSSDEEMYLPKPKRKSPKLKARKLELIPNQSTIMQFFKKTVN